MRTPEVSETELLRFIAGRSSGAIRARVAAAVRDPSSFASRWLRALTLAADYPFDIDWSRLGEPGQMPTLQQFPQLKLELVQLIAGRYQQSGQLELSLQLESVIQRLLQQETESSTDHSLAASLERMGRLQFRLGRYADSYASYSQLRELLKVSRPENPLYMQFVLGRRGQAARMAHRTSEAEASLVEACTIAQSIPPDPDRPTTAYWLAELAEVYRLRGEYELADQAIARCWDAIPPGSQSSENDQSKCLLTWARLDRELARYAQAEQRLRSILELRNPSNRELVYLELGALLVSLARMEEAAAMLAAARDAIMDVGLHHPRLARVELERGILFRHSAQFDGSITSLRHAIEIRQETLGPDHPDTAHAQRALASTYRAVGQPRHARQLCLLALASAKRAFGTNHLYVAYALNDLAISRRCLGETAAAKAELRQALRIKQDVVGRAHPSTAATLDHLSWILHAEGQFRQALAAAEEAERTKRAVFGNDHPLVARSLERRAAVLHSRGDRQLAEALLRESLTIRERSQATDHPDMCCALNGLAQFLVDAGQYDEAETHFSRAATIMQRSAAVQHPNFLVTGSNLAVLYAQMNRRDRSRDWWDRVISAVPAEKYSVNPIYAVMRHNAQYLHERLPLRSASKIPWTDVVSHRFLVARSPGTGTYLSIDPDSAPITILAA